MRHYMLIYHYADDYLARRGEVRGEHLTKAWAAVDKGEMVLGGALEPPEQTGMILFRSDNKSAAEEFARNDPYVLKGIVKAWRVAEWLTVVGHDAAAPVGR